MAEYIVIIWLIVLIAMIVLEVITSEFVTIWFALSAIPTVIVAWLLPNQIFLQVLVFFIVGMILMLFIRKYLMAYFRRNAITTNADAFVGKDALVVEAISELENGLVKFEGVIWTAVANSSIAEGKIVRILAIEGNKFIVTKIED